MLLSDYINYWFDTYVKVNCATQTQVRYKTFCKCISEGIGHIKLEKLSPPLIQKFYSTLLLETKTLKNKTLIKRYSNGTILKAHKMFHLALKCAVMWEMMHNNPTDNVMPPVDDERNIQAWDIEEATLFFKSIKDTKLYPAAYLAFVTGMREGEVSALKWENVDIKNKIIKIRYATTEIKGKLLLEDPKTKNSKRDVSIDTETAAWLRKIKLLQQAKNLALPEDEKINYQYVCSWDDGSLYRPKYISKAFTRQVEKFNFKKITFHGLRHTHASILFELGISSNVISKRLGHARTSITDDIYIHIKPQHQQEAADKFGEAMSRKNNSEEDIKNIK